MKPRTSDGTPAAPLPRAAGAGYSGAPLPKKLGLKPGQRVLLLDVPPDVRRLLAMALRGSRVAAANEDEVDLALAFATSREVLRAHAGSAASSLTSAGTLWLAWPKMSSGVPTDLGELQVREIGTTAGLVDVKICAITEVWSGLRFVYRLSDRTSG
jgi:hypothetical protein